jgi:hypothetical protein
MTVFGGRRTRRRCVRHRCPLHAGWRRSDPVRVIAKRSATIVGFGDTRIHTETATFEVRASEVANPRPGDQVTVAGETFIVQGEPERRDPERLVWTLEVRPV